MRPLLSLLLFFILNGNVFAANEAVIITESGSGTSVNEGSGSDSYTIHLYNTPSSSNTVTITITPDSSLDLGSGAGVAIIRTFNNTSSQTIYVSAVNDSVASGLHTATIRHSAQSGDSDYSGISIADVIVTIADNDIAGVTISESDGSTNISESGPTSDTFSVVLDTEPTSSVTVTVIPDGDVSVSPSSLTFTTSNWNTAQDITVTAIDDTEVEGGHTATLTYVVSSVDGMYNGLFVPSLTVNITDNDALGSVTFTETDGETSVSEAGATSDTYRVVLDSAPTANVTITITSDGQTTVSPTTLTFTTGNWNNPKTITVTAIDDNEAEGLHTSIIHHSVSSTDSNYNGISLDDIVVEVHDNDVAGVTISQSDSSTDVTEGGTADSYTVVLNTIPTANVTITITSDGQTTVSPTTITFTPLNWNEPQSISVTAVNDLYAEGLHISTIVHSAASTDSNYNGISIPNITAKVTDNDTAGIIVTASDGDTTVSESGSTDSFTVVLNARPTGTVTIDVLTDSHCSVDTSTLTFTTDNWSTPQNVTITATDDHEAQGRHTSIIIFNVTSTDVVFSGIAVTPVAVTIDDDDIAGITISESSDSTVVNEQGATSDSFSVVLDTKPIANVTITIKPDSQTTVDQSSITFTPSNWNVAKTVTVTAVDDSDAEGIHNSTIRLAAVSSDPAYNGFAIPNILVRVNDNDIAGITLTESGGSTDVNEAGPSSDTYEVVLNTPPSANVTITISTDGQSSVDKTTLTFTTTDWNVSQTVTVTAVDDVTAEGTHTAVITHNASSTDSTYNHVSIRNIIVHITDNDSHGVTITEFGGATHVEEEGPTSDTYTVVLNTQPTANVTIQIYPDSQTTVDQTTLTFTSSNWDVPQTVTVTAVDDLNPEGRHTSTLRHTSNSTDPHYSGLAIRDVIVQVEDNDATGITITESGGSTNISEAGPTSDDYTIVLNTQPTGNVTITVTPDSQTTLGDGAGVAKTYIFTSANWNIPQTVTVTAVDDAVAEGTHTSIITHSASSTDLNYNGISVSAVTAQIIDNDTVGVTIVESDGVTQVNEEAVTSDSYTLRLNTQPTANVTITVTSDSQTTVSPTTLTFTPADWDTPQTITVTAVDDYTAEGYHTSTITHSLSSTDSNYSGAKIANVTTQVTDNDSVGVTITESGGATNISEEGTTSDTYTVVLNTEPSAAVTIHITPDGESIVDNSALVFTPSNWNVPQTISVTAVDDKEAEGAHTSTITHTASSTDMNYSGLAIRNVVAYVVDNDLAGVTISQSDGSTDVSEEGPTSDDYTVVLNTPPTLADVVITITPDRQTSVGAGGATPITLTFTPANWNVPQTVTVTAVDDASAEGPHTSIITHTSSSIDPNYNAIVISSVLANVTDDDSASVIISEPNGSTLVNEAGPTSDTYSVVLSIAPTSNVTITVDPDTQTDVGPGAGQPINLIFTPTNWNAPQTVTVTAVDDLAAEGMHTSIITHTAVSADPNYNGISIRNVTTSVIDNDTAGVIITQTGGTTEVSETGPTSDAYTVQLTIPPTSDVQILVAPDNQCDVGAGKGQPVTLIFTSTNWNVPQTVTVTAVDDAVAEGAHHSSTITHTASSSDPNYNGITIISVNPIVTDNDTSGVTIAESGGSTVLSEAGSTTDTYTVVLKTPPTADVKITISPDQQVNLGAGVGESISLLFTTDDWNTPQTVSVTAVDDLLAEGLHKSTITHFAASSDSNYNGITIKSVIATIYDNDFAGVTITETDGGTLLSEDGPTSDTYTVVLNSPPQNDVVMTIDPDEDSNVGAGAGQPVILRFTSTNWNVPQSVTVTAVDDPYAEGLHYSTIQHSVVSADASYNSITIRSVIAIISDNDCRGISVIETNGLTEVDSDGTITDTYDLVLSIQPTGKVNIIVMPDPSLNIGAGRGVSITLTFTPADWNVQQTITVKADNPTVENAKIRHITYSTDASYRLTEIDDVIVHITYDDSSNCFITGLFPMLILPLFVLLLTSKSSFCPLLSTKKRI
jgi:hypothetical protein